MESSIIPFLTFPLQNLFAFLFCISAHVCEAANTNVLLVNSNTVFHSMNESVFERIK